MELLNKIYWVFQKVGLKYHQWVLLKWVNLLALEYTLQINLIKALTIADFKQTRKKRGNIY